MSPAELRVPAFEVKFEERVISGPDIVLPPGSLIELHGDSNAGCDVLLLLLGGLLPHLYRTTPPEDGHVVRELVNLQATDLPAVALGGRNLHDLSVQDRARSVGFVFGEPEIFILGDTVWEEFKYTFAAVDRDAPEIQALRRYGLYNKATYRTETLSGGEQHRLNWASVFELAPPVILADLSVANLDSEFIAALRTWLVATRTSRVAIVYGLPRGTLGAAATMWHMIDGRLVFAPPSAETLTVEEEQVRLKAAFRNRSIGNILLTVREMYRAGRTDPVGLTLHQRELLVLTGPNGAGKTTLGRILTRQVRGADIIAKTAPFLRHLRAAMSFQYPSLSFVSKHLNAEVTNISYRTICAFTQAELASDPRSLPLSRQKLAAVCAAIEAAVDYAVLDEPTAGMDLIDKERFVRLLNAADNLAFIVTTHDQALVGLGRTVTWDEIRI